MKCEIYHVDTFSEKLFGGNPAVVCPLDEWLDDNLLQKIAMENNLAETAFYVKREDDYEIRWFTPRVEVDLCGHATLATAFILFTQENHLNDWVNFYSPRSGELRVSKKSNWMTLDFPADEFQSIAISDDIVKCFNKEPLEAYKGKTDYMLVFEEESDILDVQPQLEIISKLDARGVIITAKGDDVDFVSRFFAPQLGVSEDYVTGSAYTTLTPYWAEKLDKRELSSIQLSERKGHLHCRFLGERVEISGQAKLYLSGEIFLK